MYYDVKRYHNYQKSIYSISTTAIIKLASNFTNKTKLLNYKSCWRKTLLVCINQSRIYKIPQNVQPIKRKRIYKTFGTKMISSHISLPSWSIRLYRIEIFGDFNKRKANIILLRISLQHSYYLLLSFYPLEVSPNKRGVGFW